MAELVLTFMFLVIILWLFWVVPIVGGALGGRFYAWLADETGV